MQLPQLLLQFGGSITDRYSIGRTLIIDTLTWSKCVLSRFAHACKVSVREGIKSTKKLGGLIWLTKIWDNATSNPRRNTSILSSHSSWDSQNIYETLFADLTVSCYFSVLRSLFRSSLSVIHFIHLRETRDNALGPSRVDIKRVAPMHVSNADWFRH